MPKGISSLTAFQKSEIIKRVIDNGERVPDLAKDKSEAIATYCRQQCCERFIYGDCINNFSNFTQN
jgi:hypothetical protein